MGIVRGHQARPIAVALVGIVFGGVMAVPVGAAGAAIGPDYKVTAVSDPPAVGGPGSTFSIFDTTKNAGAATETESGTNYYLSLNDRKDASDVILGGRGLFGLGKHEVSEGGLNAHVPADIAPGKYHVIACADDSNNIVESNEANNCRKSPDKIALSNPDYTITSLSNPPATGAPEATFSIFDTTLNSGGPTSIETGTNYYLSTDRKKDASDVILGGRGLFGLATGESSSGGLNAHVPVDIASGTYFVIACADDSNNVAEANENNNCAHSATRIVISSGT